MATSVNIESLPDYVKQNADRLFVQATAEAKTLDFVEIMPSVKYKDALNYLDTEIELREASCEWDPAGALNFGQRYIETHPVESQLEICWLDFQKKYMNYELNYKAGRENLPFEEKIVESLVNNSKEALEIMLWQGNSGAGVTGFLADAAEASASTVDFASGATSVYKIDAMVAALPIGMLKKGVNVFVSYTDFRQYIQEMNGSCCANRPIIDSAIESLTYLGDSRVKIVPVLGLEGTGKMVAATGDALVYGTDIEGAETAFDVWYDKSDKKFKFQLLYAAGTTVKYPDEVILGK